MIQKVGKRVHGAWYLHRDALEVLEPPDRARLDQAVSLAGDIQWNVVRLDTARTHRVTLLDYEPFQEVAFPALLESVTVDLDVGRVTRRRFRTSGNPPILHRKELLLPLDHPDRPRFEALTRALEARGLFENPRAIGHRRSWAARLEAAGVVVDDHALRELEGLSGTTRASSPVQSTPKPQTVEGEPAEEEPAVAQEPSAPGATGGIEGERGVARHRTAIVRDRLSVPMQALARYGLLDPKRSVLDYGCGQGDDVRALLEAGIPAIGWDPHFAPDTPLEPADVVNLGFVLNVIESREERREALRRAFDLARGCLAVACMAVGKADTSGLEPYGDGFLTRRGTFQKYYRQEELRDFIETVLSADAIAVGPGVFLVFRDKVLEQRFLLERQQRRFQLVPTTHRPPGRGRVEVPARDLEAVRPLLETLWEAWLARGRPVAEEELDDSLRHALRERVGSLRRADRLVRGLFDMDPLRAAARARRDDLLVYFALNLFGGRTRYQALPPELKRDVRAFFGSLRQAQEEARTLLFSVGRPEVVTEAAERAAAQGLGWLDRGHSLQLHLALLERLPPVLRCYAGCASVLYGDVREADLVKIHLRSGKLTLLFYEAFETRLPWLRERVKIDMRTRRIHFYDHAQGNRRQLLYLKSRFMAPDQAGYARQKSFDDALSATGLFDFDGFGPDAETFFSTLQSAGHVADLALLE